MACGGIDPNNIYLWSSLAGILLGGGFSFIIAPSRRRSLTAALVLFSTAVLCALCGIILGGAEPELLSHLLLWFAAASGVGFASFFFWKIVGIPLFFIIVILTASLYYSLYDWSCISPGAELGRIVMLSEGEDSIRLQYDDSSGNRSIEVFSGRTVRPVVEVIEIPDYFFIVREKRLMRIYGFEDGRQSERAVFDAGAVLTALFRLPGFSHGPAPADSFRPYPSVDYSMSMNGEGRLVITRVIE